MPATRPAGVSTTRKPARVAGTPHHALRIRRHELSMPIRDRAVRIDDDERVVKCRSGVRAVALVHADGDRDLALACSLLQRREPVFRQVDRVLEKPSVDLGGEPHVLARYEPPDPVRVAGQVRFREHHEIDGLAAYVGEARQRDLDRSLSIEQDWRALDKGDAGQAVRTTLASAGGQPALGRGVCARKIADAPRDAIHGTAQQCIGHDRECDCDDQRFHWA